MQNLCTSDIKWSLIRKIWRRSSDVASAIWLADVVASGIYGNASLLLFVASQFDVFPKVLRSIRRNAYRREDRFARAVSVLFFDAFEGLCK